MKFEWSSSTDCPLGYVEEWHFQARNILGIAKREMNGWIENFLGTVSRDETECVVNHAKASQICSVEQNWRQTWQVQADDRVIFVRSYVEFLEYRTWMILGNIWGRQLFRALLNGRL